MQLAKVLGNATATVKHDSLEGWKLCVIQVLGADGNTEGFPLLAIDQVGSRQGDTVIITSDGKAVADSMGTKTTPVRWAIMGIKD